MLVKLVVFPSFFLSFFESPDFIFISVSLTKDVFSDLYLNWKLWTLEETVVVTANVV